jgi:peptidoglycan hydrolase-like protein with peptidoglycan-binding domain
MLVIAFAIAAPTTTANAAVSGTSISSAAPLMQGTGMRDRPSVRVRRLQRVLERAGFDVGAPSADGRFGPLTAAAVRRMQGTYGLVPDAIVGPKTSRLVSLVANRQRARRQSSRNANRPSRTPQQAPSPTPRQPSGTSSRPAPDRQPAPQTAPARTEGTDTTFATVAAVVAALLAAAGLTVALRSRRGDPPARLVSIDRDLYLEGESADRHIGQFAGVALAATLPSGPGDGGSAARYLVDDPRKPAPVWVRGCDVKRSPGQLGAGEPVIGYVTVEQRGTPTGDSLFELESICDRAGWDLREIVHDDDTAAVLSRPGLTYALEQISDGRARGLVVGNVKRLAPSLSDLGALLEWFRDADAALIVPELNLDTASVQGDQIASTLITLSSWQRERPPRRRGGGLRAVQDPGRSGASS